MADESNASSAFDLGALGQKLRQEQDGTAEREAYLDRLRQQIKAGEYQVDAQALADRLLECAANEILPNDQKPDPDEEAK
jgi:anti-sigma28 factor (negative regulator of flagellin synthesis)